MRPRGDWNSLRSCPNLADSAPSSYLVTRTASSPPPPGRITSSRGRCLATRRGGSTSDSTRRGAGAWRPQWHTGSLFSELTCVGRAVSSVHRLRCAPSVPSRRLVCATVGGADRGVSLRSVGLGMSRTVVKLQLHGLIGRNPRSADVKCAQTTGHERVLRAPHLVGYPMNRPRAEVLAIGRVTWGFYVQLSRHASRVAQLELRR